MDTSIIPLFLFLIFALGMSLVMVFSGRVLGPRRHSAVKEMPYESGMDPIHDTHRRFDVRFHLVAIAFLVFDVELLFLYPWAVAAKRGDGEIRGIDAAVADGLISSRYLVFAGAMAFLVLLVIGFIYDWRKGLFRWR
ncbi:MAG: NADH-quinone oxidoreductase subunit A [Planctomycetales bacterium]|nr:NADH-quinone oxidoreductase subunit A [Planctomycetales bacterium]